MTTETKPVVAESESAPNISGIPEPVLPQPLPLQRAATGRARDLGDLVTQAAAAFQDYRLGIPGGIDRLVRLVSPLLWHTARQCGLSTAEAEDSVQQAFLALVRRGESISDPLAVVRWLTVTLRRQAWRDRAVGAQRSGTEPTDDDLPSADSAERTAVLTDEQRRLWAHVSALPERCRRLLAVIAFAPRPDYAAIAKDMDMPVGSIGPTRARCLDKLRTRLQGEEWQ
jgi:RNA polymerase sigma factor (sigma-70 family)